jgi:beta-1,4-mannosyltransferase
MVRILAWPAFKNRHEQPYNWLLNTHLTKLGVEVKEFSIRNLFLSRPHIWHLHWPDAWLNTSNIIEAYFKALTLLGLVYASRFLGTKVIWTIHNLRSHEFYHPRLERRFWQAFTKRLDGVISPSKIGLKMAQEIYPALRNIHTSIVPLGYFSELYPNHIEPDDARRKLGLNQYSKVILFIGHILTYKNIPGLIKIFRHLEDPSTRLLIAGRPNRLDLADEIRVEASRDPRVELHLNFIPEEDLQNFLNAADIVVLPFKEILNSSSALLALSFGQPLLVPEMGAMSELKDYAGAARVMTYQGELSKDILEEALDWACKQEPSGSIPEALSWESIAHKTLTAYQCVLNNCIGIS